MDQTRLIVGALTQVKLSYPLVYDQQSLTFVYIAQLLLFVLLLDYYSWSIVRPLVRSFCWYYSSPEERNLVSSGIPRQLITLSPNCITLFGLSRLPVRMYQ